MFSKCKQFCLFRGNASWDLLWMCGTSVKNRVVGIVGLGRIGQYLKLHALKGYVEIC